MRRWVLLAGLFGAPGLALGNDLGDAVEWLEERGADNLTTEWTEHRSQAHDDAALPMINSRDVARGKPLEDYDCRDAPIDGFSAMRTSGQQGWALRICNERLWKRGQLPGFATLGDIQLNEHAIAPMVAAAGEAYDVPPILLDTIVRYVSGYRPQVVSEAGHVGLLQLLPDVLARMGIEHGNLLDPQENLRTGARFLRALTYRYGNLKTALAAFRDGPEVIERHGGMPKDRRYRWFVREVMRIYLASEKEFPMHLGVESIGVVWTWLE